MSRYPVRLRNHEVIKKYEDDLKEAESKIQQQAEQIERLSDYFLYHQTTHFGKIGIE